MTKPEIILLVGNIGSGKSTLVNKLLKKGYNHIVISRDSLRYMIGGGNYRFDPKLESMIHDMELKIIETCMKNKVNIIVDEVGINKQMRERYIPCAIKNGYTITVIELPYFSKRTSVNRRMKNPHGQFDRKIWNSVWERFNNLYERPSKKEGINKIIR